MSLIPYLILAYITLGAQAGLSAFIQVGGAPPNLVLLAAVFVAINAPKEPALLGCFGLGIMQDFLTAQPLGTYALSYGLMAMFVTSMQQLFLREHILTHLSMALAGSVICATVILLHGVFWLNSGERVSPSTLLYASVYTTVLAPFILGVLQKLRRT